MAGLSTDWASSGSSRRHPSAQLPGPLGKAAGATPRVSGTGVPWLTAWGALAVLGRLATLHWPSLGSRGVPNSATCSRFLAPVVTAGRERRQVHGELAVAGAPDPGDARGDAGGPLDLLHEGDDLGRRGGGPDRVVRPPLDAGAGDRNGGILAVGGDEDLWIEDDIGVEGDRGVADRTHGDVGVAAEGDVAHVLELRDRPGHQRSPG